MSSLQTRLTLVYSILLGAILLIFGVLIYFLVGYLLINQTDTTLRLTVSRILQNTRVNQAGELSMVDLPSLELGSNVFIQLWDRNQMLRAASPGISQMDDPFDSVALKSEKVEYRYVDFAGERLRVLSVPLEISGRYVGVMQAAMPMRLIDSTKRTLLNILEIGTFASILVSVIVLWITIGRVIAPLKIITETAQQIVRADDLSRRIPYHGSHADEIGMLIASFNHTLERMEKLFSRQKTFLSDVSHELRTPLTVIKGSADLIRKRGADEESLSSIKYEVDRLTRMVEDVLALDLVESGKLPIHVGEVELDTLLLEVFQEMRVFAGARVIIKLTDIDQAQVNGDYDRLKQVFINLLSNAIQYTPQGGEVFVSMTKGEEMARVAVRDTGPGIPAKDLPFIFDRFYRGEKSRTRSKISGYGLGLSIAHAIVDRHGGRIEIESKEGQGTTFCVWLPLK